jgi:Na+/melibiose symporter-like transporter
MLLILTKLYLFYWLAKILSAYSVIYFYDNMMLHREKLKYGLIIILFLSLLLFIIIGYEKFNQYIKFRYINFTWVQYLSLFMVSFIHWRLYFLEKDKFTIKMPCGCAKIKFKNKKCTRNYYYLINFFIRNYNYLIGY